MYLKKITLNFLIAIFIQTSNAAAAVSNYGPYTVEYDQCEMCAGPRSNNATEYTVRMTKDKDGYVLHFNFTVLLNSQVNEIKITVYTVKENKRSVLVNYRLNDPCHHFAVASMLEKYLYAHRCVIKKGPIECKINISEVAKAFFGTSFFYGEFRVKAVILSKQGNLCCVALNSIYTKKT